MTVVGRALDDPALVELLADVTAGRTLVDIIDGVRTVESTGIAAARAALPRRR